MPPRGLLSLAIAITALAAIAQRSVRIRWERRLRALAAEWGLNYSPRDQLRLGARVAAQFPIPGAANLRISDLIYGTEGARRRYVFTAEFTVGVVHRKRRMVRAAAFAESRQLSGEVGDSVDSGELTLAPADLPLLEQYRHFAPPVAALPT